MASRESMIRNINRQIEQHLRTFGEGSREYQDLMRNLESEIGRPRFNKDGRPYYSRAEWRLYDEKALQNAADMVKEKGTAFSKAQQYIRDLLDEGIDPTDQNIRNAASIEQEVSDNFELVYEYLQEHEEEFENSDTRMQFSGNAGANATKQDLVDILTKVTKVTARKSILDVIEEAKDWKEKRNEEIRKQAAKTRRSRKMTPKEVEQKLRLQPEEKPSRIRQTKTKVDDRKAKVYGKQPKLNRGTKKDKGVKK